jgi:hypothetical protein
VNWLLQLFRFRPPAVANGGGPAICVRCNGRSGHPVIYGDGALVCFPCVLRNGRAAADPDRLTEAEVELLLTAHGDVVSLVRVDVGFSSFQRWSWREGAATL